MKNSNAIHWQSLVREAILRRKEQKLTQKELAVLVGVSVPTVQKFERQKTSIRLDTCLKILRALGLETESTPD